MKSKKIFLEHVLKGGRFEGSDPFLRDNETITLKVPGKETAPVYSKNTRSRVLSINKKPYQDICYLTGAISGFQVEKGVFYFLVGDSESISGPLNETFDVVLRDLASQYGRQETSVSLIGLAKYDPDGSIAYIDRLQHIAIYKDGEPYYFPDPVKRLDEFVKYEDGWLDGESCAFIQEDLFLTKNWIKNLLKVADIPAPFIYPLPENSISAEWSFGFWEVICSFDFTAKTIILTATHTKRDELREKNLRFENSQSYEEGASFLKNLLEPSPK